MPFRYFSFVLGLSMALFITGFFGIRQVLADTTINTLDSYLGSCGGTLSEGWTYIGDNDDYEGQGQVITWATSTISYLKSITWNDRAGGGSGMFACPGCAYTVRLCSTVFPFEAHDLEAGDYSWPNMRLCTGAYDLIREATFVAPSASFATSTKTWDLTVAGEPESLNNRYPYLVFYQEPDVAGDHVVSLENWQCSSAGDPFQKYGQLELHTGSNGYSLTYNREIRLSLTGTDQQPQEEVVEVIELPEFTGTAQVGMDSFYFPESLQCQIATSCPITIQYRYEDIGRMVLLMPEEATSTLDYADMVEALPDQYLLKYDLYPTVRNNEQIDTYRYFLYDERTGEGELFADTKIYWVTELDDTETGIFGTVWSYFKRMFPLSIYYDVAGVIEEQTNNASTTLLSVGIEDLLVDPAYTATGTIISAQLIQDNLPIWDTHIYPLQRYIIHFVFFMIFIGIIYRRAQPDVE